eukprot:m.667501 g.667501  ORF g.667501 m.667501 type:complete len:247 (-) comp58508_c0_seq11:7074-7814(-)
MVLLGAGCCAGVVSVLLALRWGNADHEFLELQGLLRALPQLFFAAHCVRTAPVRLLSSARVWVRDSAAQFVAVAMIFSAFGDFILALATRYPEFFILGLLMFLLAHLSNIVSLCLAPVERTTKSLKISPKLGAGLAAVYLAIFWWATDRSMDRTMYIACLVYCLTIGTVLWRALARIGCPGEPSGRHIHFAVGYVFFTLSDALIARRKFVGPLLWDDELVIIATYVLAQAFIAKSQPFTPHLKKRS